MWTSGKKTLHFEYAGWRDWKGTPKKQFVPLSPSHVKLPIFKTALQGVNLYPLEVLASFDRCNAIKYKNYRMSQASIFLGMSVLSIIENFGISLDVTNDLEGWKDFVEKGMKGQLGAGVTARIMEHLGTQWIGHWEQIFPNSSNRKASPDFIFWYNNKPLLMEATASSRDPNDVGATIRRKWKKQIEENYLHDRKPTDAYGACLGLRIASNEEATLFAALGEGKFNFQSATGSNGGEFDESEWDSECTRRLVLSHLAGVTRLVGLTLISEMMIPELKSETGEQEEVFGFEVDGQEYCSGFNKPFEVHLGGETRHLIYAINSEVVHRMMQVLPNEALSLNQPIIRKTMYQKENGYEAAHFTDGMVAFLFDKSPLIKRIVI